MEVGALGDRLGGRSGRGPAGGAAGASGAAGRRPRAEDGAGAGALIREWRKRRRLSQLDLALDAGISARHLSFVETGRSRPSADMILRLAEELEVPLRERNRMLLAAGHAPIYPERALDSEEMAPVREAMQLVLDGHMPYPSLVVDRSWELVAANEAISVLVEGVDPALLEPPLNVLRIGLHPKGMAPRILNYTEWRAHLLDRLARHAAASADPAELALLEELRGYEPPGVGASHSPRGGSPGSEGLPERGRDGPGHGERRSPAEEIFVPLRLASSAGELSLFATVATFGTAVDITVAELAIESFFPADEATGRAMRQLAKRRATWSQASGRDS